MGFSTLISLFAILTSSKINCLTRAFLILFFLSIHFIINGQTVRRPVAAVYAGLGSYSINHVDVFSFTNNQASLAQMKSASAGVYGERRFMMDELSLYQLAIAVPTNSGNFGVKAGYFGSSDYNESQMGLAYARKLGSKVDIGVQFNYNGIHVSGYGNSSAINFEIGTIFHLTDKLHAGVHAYNPVGGKYGKNSEEKLASVYTVGLGYEASDKFFVSAEIEKEEHQPVNINGGIQYKILPQFMARAGISTNTSNVYAGVALFLKTFRLDVVASYHPQLGVTPGLMLVYNFSKSNNE